jgi:hypothetical protein
MLIEKLACRVQQGSSMGARHRSLAAGLTPVVPNPI